MTYISVKEGSLMKELNELGLENDNLKSENKALKTKS